MNSFDPDSLIVYCRENGRVCPRPEQWQKLTALLSSKQVSESILPPPLILGAWHFTSNLEKMLRLNEQIQWALDNNAFETIDGFLRALSEESWHHLYN